MPVRSAASRVAFEKAIVPSWKTAARPPAMPLDGLVAVLAGDFERLAVAGGEAVHPAEGEAAAGPVQARGGRQIAAGDAAHDRRGDARSERGTALGDLIDQARAAASWRLFWLAELDIQAIVSEMLRV